MILRARKSLEPALPTITLQSTRIFMRPPQLSDWQDWSEIRHSNQDYLQPFEPLWPADCLSADFFVRRLQRQIHDWQADQAQSFLVFKNDSTLVGGMNINTICRAAAQYAALGYWIDEAHQGQGYMAEALQLTIKYCFETLDLHRINASCIPQNTRSKKTLLRAGFIEEGFARKYLQINGEWQDHVLFGLPREDWKNSK